jgi:hypothetical protein
MSDTGNEGGQQQGGDEGFKPITTQEDFNKAIAERVSRERAKFADYNDLKAKAAKVDEALEAGKTAEQKFNDRLAALEQELNSTRSQALRARIQAKFSVSDEDAQLLLTGTDEETLTAQAQRIAQRDADRKKRGNVAPKEGGTADNGGRVDGDMREFTRSLFGRVDD